MTQHLGPYGLDPRKFLRGESVNYGTQKKYSTDTEQEASTGPHSVTNNPGHMEIISKSQSTERRHNYLRELICQRKETERITAERVQRIINLQSIRETALKKVEIASRRAVSLMKAQEGKRIMQQRETELRAEMQRQVELKKLRAQMLKEGLERKRELLRDYIVRTKQQERIQIRKINKDLLERIRKVESENMEERKRQIVSIKEREKIIPFKVRYMQLKRNERMKELLYKKAEEEESVVSEKRREFEDLGRIELALHQQLKEINRSKNEYAEMSSNRSMILNATPNLSISPNGRNHQDNTKGGVRQHYSYIV